MNLIKSLQISDYITLLGMIFCWFGFLFLINNNPNYAVLSIGFAFLFDNIDGYVARKLKISSKFGLELDSFLDFAVYILFSGLFCYIYVFDKSLIGIVAGMFILICGTLRLVRMNINGLIKDQQQYYYVGLISPFALLTVLVQYMSIIFTNYNNQILNLFTIIIICLLMISSTKFKKIEIYVPLLIFSIFLCLILYIEYYN